MNTESCFSMLDYNYKVPIYNIMLLSTTTTSNTKSNRLEIAYVVKQT